MSIKNESSCQTISSVAVLLGTILLLIGIYSGLRIWINTLLFDRYPSTGVLQIASYPMYGQREEDCDFSTPYYSYDGKPRSATDDEKKIESEQAQRCLDAIQETRRVAFIQDIGTASFFLFIGLGILTAKRFIA